MGCWASLNAPRVTVYKIKPWVVGHHSMLLTGFPLIILDLTLYGSSTTLL